MQKSNIAELMLNETVEELMSLGLTEQGNALYKSSDYDRFLRFCRCLPLFYGHPIKVSAEKYLKRYFDINLPIIPENAEKLWQITAEHLLKSDCDIPLFSIEEESLQEPLPPLSAGEPYTAYVAAVLCQTDAQTWGEWQAEMCARLDQILMQNPLRIIRFDLDEQTSMQRPSLYHVEQALQKKHRSVEDYSLLLAQVLRFVCECAKKSDVRIHLHADTPQVVGLLRELEKSVGLPPMLCFSHDDSTQDALIDWIRTTSAPVCLGLVYHNFLSYEHFEHAVRSLAKKYPIGKLSVLEDNLQKHFILS